VDTERRTSEEPREECQFLQVIGDTVAADNPHPRFDFRDKWILSLIANACSIGGLEIAFFRCEDTRCAENDLLFRYLRDHLELPPANSRLEKLTGPQKAELTLMSHPPRAERLGSEAIEGRRFPFNTEVTPPLATVVLMPTDLKARSTSVLVEWK
jgi:hypothetical protein